jgi:hypothetical protein
MNEENITELQTLLERLGFSGKVAWDLEFYKQTDAPMFHLVYRRSVGEDALFYTLLFQKESSGTYRFDGYSLSLTRVEAAGAIRDIDARVLEENLRRVDRYYDFFLADADR